MILPSEFKTWRECLINVSPNSWDPKFPGYPERVGFTNNNRTMFHREGTAYTSIRTVKGYKTGIHYWEVVPHKCSSNAHNTYIGVALPDSDNNWFIGADKSKSKIIKKNNFHKKLSISVKL